jgi:predicted site-specific integrase-resolvase
MLTTPEVAAALGIEDSGVRSLVARGHLHPDRRNARPMRFRTEDVYDLQVARRRKKERHDHITLWEEVDIILAATTHNM